MYFKEPTKVDRVKIKQNVEIKIIIFTYAEIRSSDRGGAIAELVLYKLKRQLNSSTVYKDSFLTV